MPRIMAKRTSVLAQLPAIEEAHVSLRRMAREVQLMLKDALDAYIHATPHLQWM